MQQISWADFSNFLHPTFQFFLLTTKKYPIGITACDFISEIISADGLHPRIMIRISAGFRSGAPSLIRLISRYTEDQSTC